MNTIYITNTGRVEVDESGHIVQHGTEREAIRSIMRLSADTRILYEMGESLTELRGKEGDILVTFYEDRFPNKAILVNSKEWEENLIAYAEKEQKIKEEWAKKKSPIGECCDIESRN